MRGKKVGLAVLEKYDLPLFKKWLNGLGKEFPVTVKENLILADMDMEG